MAKICFINYDNYPVLNPDFGSNYIGGESVQQVLLARAFAKRGHKVSTIVADLGQPDGEIIDGIRIWKTFKPGSGLPVLRFIHPKLTSIVSALKRADADVYYQSCAGMITGLTAWYAKRNNRKFVFRIAHDTDCIPGKQIIPYWRDRKLYEYGLRQADLIAAQSSHQARLLKENYGLDSVEINMAVEPPSEDADRDIDVLWVNNFREFKKPERFLDLAAALPEMKMIMIGGPCPGEETFFEELRKRAETLPNLRMTGFVPYHEVNTYYARAKVFVNTSDTEGFPNSYLQSWVRGTPVVAFFDPDGLIEREGLGHKANDMDDMAGAVRKLIDDTRYRESVSTQTRQYAMTHYHPDRIAEKYEALFDNLWGVNHHA